MRTLVRYARADQFPPGTDLRIAARDSVIRYCRHFGLNFRWLHDQPGEVWREGRPMPRQVLAWRSEAELIDPQYTCPYCGDPVTGLLSGCDKPQCLTADLDYDAAMDARCDL